MQIPDPAWSPLEPAVLAAAAGPDWTVRLLATAASTNAVAAEDPVPGTVVVADHQTAGRGRLDRSWETPPGSALTFSAVVDPALDDQYWPLLPLATALAVAGGLRAATGLAPVLKWPNDVLLPPGDAAAGAGKVAGILLERVQSGATPVAVIGVGVNVGMRPDQLPVPTATSLAVAGAVVDRTAVLRAVLTELTAELRALAAGPAALLERYRDACDTLGRRVRVDLPDGAVLEGTAEAVDEYGRLVVDGTAVGAGDVVHVRA